MLGIFNVGGLGGFILIGGGIRPGQMFKTREMKSITMFYVLWGWVTALRKLPEKSKPAVAPHLHHTHHSTCNSIIESTVFEGVSQSIQHGGASSALKTRCCLGTSFPVHRTGSGFPL